MNVITFNFWLSVFTDGNSVANKLNNHFKFDKFICIEKSENMELVEKTWDDDNLVLLDYYEEVYKCKYRDTEVNDMPPLPRRIVEDLALHWYHIYHMHRDERLTFRQMDRELKDCFTYWNYMIDELNIDLAMFNGVPHAIWTYTLYAMCKIRGVKTIIHARSCVPGYSFCYDEIFDKFERLESAYQAALKMKEPYLISDYMLNTYASKMADGTYRAPASYKMSNKISLEFENTMPLGRKITNILTGWYRIDPWKRFFAGRRYRRLLKTTPRITEEHYRKISSPADFSRRFIYMPLHMQPEMTTSPLGNVYVDLFLMAKTLAHSVKGTDIMIYVKEHPDQKKDLRLSRRELYNQINELPNVILVDIDESTFELQEKCVTTATCSGMVIMESLFRYKPILVFGNHTNNLAPNVYQVSDVSSCRAAIDDILAGNFSVSEKQRNAFLYALEQTSFRGYVRSEYAPDFGLTQDESSENVYLALVDEIEKWRETENN